jgi:diguanylate cyclase (GGDEF)-like protein
MDRCVKELRNNAETQAWLQQRLNEILEQARQNEQTLRKFQSFELCLLASASLAHLFKQLIHDSRGKLGWDVVTLMVFDPEFEIQRLLEQGGEQATDYPEIIFVSDGGPLTELYGDSRAPLISAFYPPKHQDLFPGISQPLASLTLLPLIRDKCLIGSLNLGAHTKERFSIRAATDFLRHLAAVISVCLETAVFRERLKFLGLTDGLTGVNNRRFFDQRLGEEAARAKRTSAPLSCLFIDLDHFKRINDNHGHSAGDKVLQTVGRIIRSQLRTVDVVARYGGEEFVVLLSQTDEQRALEVAERMRTRIHEHRFQVQPGLAIALSVSVGLATLDSFTPALDIVSASTQLLEHADAALYQAKRWGRNRVVNANRVYGDIPR